jgi:hypothetical protein
LYNKAVRLNHEYLADNGAIRDSLDIKSYAETLLSFISCERNIPLTSGSNHSLTKKRLIMITKNKSNSIVSGIRISMTLILLLLFFLFISFKQSNYDKSAMIQNDAKGIVLNKNGKLQERREITNTGPLYISHSTTFMDSLVHQDSLISDTILMKRITPSFDSIDKKITYIVAGYIKIDSINKKVVILVGEAVVKYGEIEIKADSIVFDMSKNLLFASGRLDKSGKIIGKPIFKEGTNKFKSDELIYNFETRKALINNIKP